MIPVARSLFAYYYLLKYWNSFWLWQVIYVFILAVKILEKVRKFQILGNSIDRKRNKVGQKVKEALHMDIKNMVLLQKYLRDLTWCNESTTLFIQIRDILCAVCAFVTSFCKYWCNNIECFNNYFCRENRFFNKKSKPTAEMCSSLKSKDNSGGVLKKIFVYFLEHLRPLSFDVST